MDYTFLTARADFLRWLQERAAASPTSLLTRFSYGIGLTPPVSFDPVAWRDAEYAKRNVKYADAVLRPILELGALYIKMGQVCALRGDIFPREWIKKFRTLHSDAPYLPISEILPIIEQSLNRPLDSVFQSIGDKPLGAASIGQVHDAVLLSGEHVVVKIQYPEVAGQFRGDFRNLRLLARLAQPSMEEIIKEMEKQFLSELDYRIEATNLALARENIEKSPYKSKATIPAPYMEFCSKFVLVMEKLDGERLTDFLTRIAEEFLHARGIHMSLMDYIDMIQREEIQKERNGPVRSVVDENGIRVPLPLSSSEQEEQEKSQGPMSIFPTAGGKPISPWMFKAFNVVMKVRDVLLNALRLSFNLTLGWFLHPIPYKWSTKVPDLVALSNLLLDIHGHQIFHDGFFNGDPHPGNFLVLKDNSLGLIDYGQVKALTLIQRAVLAVLYKALYEDDMQTAMLANKAFGFRTKKNSDEINILFTKIYFDYENRAMRGDLSANELIEYLALKDPIVTMGPQLTMVSRVSIILRSFATSMGYPVHTSSRFGPIASSFLEKHPQLHQKALEVIQRTKELDKMGRLEDVVEEISQIVDREEFYGNDEIIVRNV